MIHHLLLLLPSEEHLSKLGVVDIPHLGPLALGASSNTLLLLLLLLESRHLLLLQISEHGPLLLLELSHGGHVDVGPPLSSHVQARLPGPRRVHAPLRASSRHDINNRPPGGPGASAWPSLIFGGPLLDKSCHELRVGAQDVEDLLLLMRRAGGAQSPQQLL